MSEQAIVTAKANVMIYDDATKKWNSGGSTPGLAKVQIYQHLINQSYRVVGRKLQDQEVVINCMLVKGLKYNQANPTFLQWRDVNAKQVYGLNFQSKEEADAFAQILKLAVDNLNRIAVAAAANIPANVNSTGSSANSSCSSGNMMMMMNGNVNGTTNGNHTNNGNGDNISIGKRSTTSSDYNQSIYDDDARQAYTVNPTNGMLSHHNSTNAIYNNGGANMNNNVTSAANLRLQQQNLVTTPPLSTSTSSCSSSSSTSSGLTISINNQNGSSSNLNGQQQLQRQSAADSAAASSYPYSDHRNGPPMVNGVGYNNGHPSLHQQQQQQLQPQQQPMFQSSPAPPPPPPLPMQLFASMNMNNGHHINHQNNNNNNDQYGQKIYDVIPDANYPASSGGMSTTAAVAPPPPPPPPPLPAGGLFSGLGSVSNSVSNAAVCPPPPPPPVANNFIGEINKLQSNRPTLKKVEESVRGAAAAPPPQLDFLTEIRQKLERKQQQSGENSSSVDSDATSCKPSNFLSAANQQRKSSAQLNGGVKTGFNGISAGSTNGIIGNGGSAANGNFESPKVIKKNTSTPNVVTANGINGAHHASTSATTNGYADSASGINYDRLKQELVVEFRKELQSFKGDIINAILNELRR